VDEYLVEALEIVKSQASVRNMTAGEMSYMVKKVASSIRNMAKFAMLSLGNRLIPTSITLNNCCPESHMPQLGYFKLDRPH